MLRSLARRAALLPLSSSSSSIVRSAAASAAAATNKNNSSVIRSTTSSLFVTRHASLSSAPANADLTALVVIERLPLLKPLLPQWEKDFKVISDEAQRNRTKVVVEGGDEGDLVAATDASNNAAEAEVDLFEIVDPNENAHNGVSMTSLLRHPRDFLYLLVKDKSGKVDSSIKGKDGWTLPASSRGRGETMRKVVDRAAQSAVGGTFPLYRIGNAPLAHLNSKLFFYRQEVLWDESAKPAPAEDTYSEYMWVTVDEMRNYLPSDVVEVVARIV